MRPSRPPRRSRVSWRTLFRPFQARQEGTMPAGLVLVLVLGSLLIAMVLNADATLRKSEAKGDGWRNDVAKTVADVSDTFKLTWLRSEVDAALGKNQGTDTDVEELLAQQEATIGDGESQADPGDGTPATTPAPVLPQIPAPTPESKLRFWVGGDSITETFGTSMQKVVAGTGVIEPTLDYRVSTGLARPDYFNWPEHLLKDVLPTDPQVMVIMFGANDGQGMTGPDGTVYQRGTPEWLDEYRRRVAATMDLLKDPDNDRVVIWVGPPVMRPGSGVHEMDQLNYIYWSEAKDRPWIQYFDSWPFFSDANLQYVSEAPNADGVSRGLRQKDGVHLSTVGGNRLSWAVLGRIEQYVDLSAGTTTPPPADAPPPDIKERTEIPPETPGAE
jgi:hypothetical protein